MAFRLIHGLVKIFVGVAHPVNPRVADLLRHELLQFVVVVPRLPRVDHREKEVLSQVLQEIKRAQGFPVGFVVVAFHQFR